MIRHYYDKAEAAEWMRQDNWNGIAVAIEKMEEDLNIVHKTHEGSDEILSLIAEERLLTLLSFSQVGVIRRECGYFSHDVDRNLFTQIII